MRFVKISSGALFNESSIRASHPHTSFPAPLTELDVSEFGYSCLAETPPPAHDSSTHVAVEGPPSLIDGVFTQTWTIQPLSADVVAAIAASKAKDAEQTLKMAGVEFDGVMCSAAKDDQDGLLSVWIDYTASPESFEPTRFYFANGATLTLTKDNIANFWMTWKPFRRSFFSV